MSCTLISLNKDRRRYVFYDYNYNQLKYKPVSIIIAIIEHYMTETQKIAQI